ncbi:B12-binding domain-containing radical SAM protein [candidate division KSB1 bacterium]|nr:B12-binding domain-containing radical SAM protein [candidate division KSB1 bacterium]
MKICLISPASGRWRGLGKKKFFNGKTFRFSQLSLLSVAALTPDKHELKLIDEQIEDVSLNEDFDLVGITVMTATAPRSYELCDLFRKKNIPVVLGGFHPTFNVEEAREYAYAIVIGPADGAWPELLADAENKQLKKIYHGTVDEKKPIKLPKHLLKKSGYLSPHTTYATLGCRNKCSFCSITSFYGGKRYQRPIEDVVAELGSFKEKFFMFIDDNLTQDREYIVELLKAIAPLKKKWVTQASIEITDDDELLALLQQSGCAGVFVGLESFSEDALCSQNKTIKQPRYYEQAVRKFHQYGIFVEAGMIFGFDSDSPEIFEKTLKILDRIGIDTIQASILTPLPGTTLFKEMKDRIVDFNWEHYDYKYAVYNPALISREDLMGGLQWINKRFYSPRRILQRICRWLFTPAGYKNMYFPLFLNIAYWGRQFQFKVRGYNPANVKRKEKRAEKLLAARDQFRKYRFTEQAR